MERTRVYIAGPYTQGDVALNVRRAVQVASELLGEGYIPYVPHLTQLWHLLQPQTYETWFNYDREWLLLCHALYRLPGASDGADRETEWAASAGIPIYTELSRLFNSLSPQQQVWDPRGQEIDRLKRQLAEANLLRDATLLNLSPEEYKARLEQYQAALATA